MPVWSFTLAHYNNVYNQEKELYYGAIAHELMKSHMGWDVNSMHYVRICTHTCLHLNVHGDPFDSPCWCLNAISGHKFRL